MLRSSRNTILLESWLPTADGLSPLEAAQWSRRADKRNYRTQGRRHAWSGSLGFGNSGREVGSRGRSHHHEEPHN
jgi:hypothetical protein